MTLLTLPAAPEHRPLFDAYRLQRGFLDRALDGGDGQLWADSAENPRAALVYAAFSYAGGDAGSPAAGAIIEQALALGEPLVLADPAWQALVERAYADRYERREWISFNSQSCSIVELRAIKSRLPAGVAVERLDLETARRLFAAKIRVFRTYGHDPERFINEGAGFCARNGDQIVSIINTMAIHGGKVKGYIDTHPKHRGQGLATAVAAHLLEYCLERALEYCWEAANPASAAIARRLGMQEDGRIAAYVPTRH